MNIYIYIHIYIYTYIYIWERQERRVRLVERAVVGVAARADASGVQGDCAPKPETTLT